MQLQQPATLGTFGCELGCRAVRKLVVVFEQGKIVTTLVWPRLEWAKTEGGFNPKSSRSWLIGAPG